MNVKLYRWERALDIAVSNKTHVDTVIAYRQRFLDQYKKEEDIDKFKTIGASVSVDWETIKNKIKADKEREAAASQ
jgi:intraflagellar transport protein 80